MSTGRKGGAGKTLPLPKITMDWLKRDMLNDPRVVALFEAGKLDNTATKSNIITVLKNHNQGGMLEPVK